MDKDKEIGKLREENIHLINVNQNLEAKILNFRNKIKSFNEVLNHDELLREYDNHFQIVIKTKGEIT